MEIRDRKSIEGAAAIRSAAKPQAAPGATAPEAAARAPDVVDIAGIPEAELTANVRRAFAALMAEVDQLRRQLEDAKTRINYLEKLVDEDPLMPVVNRRAFVRELSRMMAYAQRYGAASSIVYFDVNGLKGINDRYGHAAGDAVLVAVARILVENVRATDVVGRLGGDEMGVLLVQTDQAQAWHKAGELAELIKAHPIEHQGTTLEVGVAYGVYTFAQGDNAGSAIDAADRAMYESKKQQMKSAT
ncbi:MAG TPA: GGDEF domain-containing protein [Stellaceae bacterium]|nr:GGDEF domain-containing protein [Stellaceae bacterium]